MPIPYFGTFKTFISFPGLRSNASETGFIIRKGKNVIARTVGFKDVASYSIGSNTEKVLNRANYLVKILFYAQLIIFAGVLLFLTDNAWWVKIIWLLGMIFPFLINALLFGCLLAPLGTNPAIREYHACEHKVIWLLREGFSPTIENLKKMPKTSLACGSSLAIVTVFSPLFFLAGIFLRFGNLKYIDRGNINIVDISISAWPLLALLLSLVPAFLGQFFFAVKEPRESIMQEGLEVAQKAHEIINGVH